MDRDADRDCNFLTEEIATYTRERAAYLESIGAARVYPRLDHSMLASQPLCFNLFGCLRDHLAATAQVMGEVLNLDMGEVVSTEVEVPPRRKDKYLNDNTSFDTMIEYRRGSTRGFLAIETKYTEPFSPVPPFSKKGARKKLAENVHYKNYSALPEWTEGVHEQLGFGNTTNQLWRNALLALAVKEHGLGKTNKGAMLIDTPYQECWVVVISARADVTAQKAVERVSSLRTKDDAFIRHVTFNDIVQAAQANRELRSWAERFRTRYLDLTPVFDSPYFADLKDKLPKDLTR